MKTTMLLILIALLLYVPSATLAHDKSLHRGKPVEGEVTSVASDRITVQADSETWIVTFAEDVVFEIGDDTVEQDRLKSGQHVAVFGTKLPGGEIVAREVIIHERGGEEHRTKHGEHR